MGRPLNSPAFTQMVKDIRHAMPDLQVVVEECIAEGYKVVTLEHPDRHHPAACPRLSTQRQSAEHLGHGLLDAHPKP